MTINKKIITSIVVILFTPLFGWALNTVASGFKSTSTGEEIDAHGECRSVRHTGATASFVPTRTSSEWTTFINKKPSMVTACAPRVFSGKSANNSLSNTKAFILNDIKCGPGYYISSFKVKSNVEQGSYAIKSFDSMNWGEVHYQRVDKHSSNSNSLEVLSSDGSSLVKMEGINGSTSQIVANTIHNGLIIKCSDYDKSGGECTIEVQLLCERF